MCTVEVEIMFTRDPRYTRNDRDTMLVVPKTLETIQHMFEFCVRCAKCVEHFF